MKKTNFEVSKKLKEIGFNVETEYYWHDINGKTELHHVAREGLGDYKSYDLETLLEALPKYVARNSDTCGEKNSLQVCVASKQIYYEDNLGIYKGYRDLKQLFFTTTIDNESLADTAGRLLIKLFEAGIVNFNK